MKRSVLLLAALAITLSATPAFADCKSDLASLKARVAMERDPDVRKAAEKHVKRAEIETKGSESECRNAVTRGWRAMAEAREAAASAAQKAAAKGAR
ncbi:MAG: hypothetical protein IRZ04_13340 [Rhodospirillales bacterium]|nr:hypothetical protein [Rhodospirillales bacterium]